MTENHTYSCENCKEPTKKFAGFMDGHDKEGNRTHGVLYTCENTSCKDYKNFDDSDAVAVVKALNKANNVDIRTLKDKFHATHNTYGSLAQMLGVGSAQVSRWMTEHEAMPKETYEYLLKLLSK